MSVLHPKTAPAVPASTTYVFNRVQLINALDAYAAPMPEPQRTEFKQQVLELLDGPGGLRWKPGT